ncbi:hypothetical protein DDN45_18400, partial [Vibrio cholerae]|nr:hypothetical protein [Vibrio cholerae]
MRKMILRLFLDSSRGMQNVYIGLILLFLSLLRITLEIYPTVAVIDDRNAFPLWEYFTGNLLPELSGMVIEVLLFLFVIDVIREVERSRIEKEQKRLDFQRKVEIEHRLRHQLRILIRRIFKDVEIEHDETCAEFKFHADKYIENQRLFDLLGAKIAEESVDSHFYEEAKKLAGFELDLLMAVTQLCTELSYDHMKTWMNILFFLKRISIGQNIDERTVYLVKNISAFEQHSHKQGYDQ